MPSFNITGFSTTERVLESDQTGFIGVNGALVVNGEDAVSQSGFVSYLVVHGSLIATGTAERGVNMTGSNMRINVGESGSITSTNFRAIETAPLISNWIQNAGLIQGQSQAIRAEAGDDGAAIEIINTGTITAVSTAIQIGTGTQSGSVFNTGSIVGSSGTGVSVTSGSEMRFDNAGFVIGQDFSYESTSDLTVDLVTNVGDFLGAVDLGGGNDRFDARSGTVAGDIALGDGDDVAIGTQEADVIIAAEGEDIVRAGGGDDTVTGGTGNDTLRGAGGDDDLRGEDDDDLIFGGTGDDVIRGNTGNDELRGGTGDDNMAGGSGDDEIHGGRGDDTLTGNSGADVFVFNASAGNDLITDFRVNLDMIDLSAFGTRFNRVDAATEVVNGNAIIDLDMLGGEGTIVVRGVGGSLDANDFIF